MKKEKTNPTKKCECNQETCTCKENTKKECNCDEEIQKLKTKIDKLENELKEKENNILKEKAETINYRKRKDEEIAKTLKYCNQDLIEQILPILDNFERAVKLDDNDLNDELSKFLKGFKMVWCNLEQVLKTFGVKPIDGSSKPFDPNYHEALLTEKIEGVEPGIVIEVLQKGYLLKDKVIRHAKVKVSI